MIEKILESSVQESNISKINGDEIYSRKTTVSEIPQKKIAELADSETKIADIPDTEMIANTSIETLLENIRNQVENFTENTVRLLDETKNEGLTDEEKQKIKEETGWSDEIIDAIGSWEEYEIYKNAGLQEVEINGRKCLIRTDIDLDQKDEDGITNRERMERGRPPITKDGKEVELHHIGQKANGPLAELTTEEHRGVGNDTVLHNKNKESEINRTEFAKERQQHWKERVENS